MITVININEINLILKDYQGAKAMIWSFVLTHRKLFIQLDHPSKDKVVYLVAIGCQQIQGPFSWKDANLCVSEEKEQLSTEFNSLIVDDVSGFQLVASGGVILAYDLEKENIDAW